MLTRLGPTLTHQTAPFTREGGAYGHGRTFAHSQGLATPRLCLPMAEVLTLFLQTTVTQLLFVAVRFMPMGQAQGQILLAALTPLRTRTAATLSTATPQDLHAFTAGADMASMRHETQTVRIFGT